MINQERKQELITRILDRTPYINGSAKRGQLERKLARVLTEDDLYIIALATNISIETIRNRLQQIR